MSHSIQKGEGLAAALGRIAAEETDLALKELRGRHRDKAIHSARKKIKRLRALLRSVRVALPEKLFQSENRRLAGAGHKISPLRDVQVQLRTLGKLRAAQDPAGGKIRRDLLRRQENLARKIPALRKAVRGILNKTRGSIGSWPLDKTTPATLLAGLKRLYKQGRSAFKTAGQNPTTMTLHEWRKKVKALGYGLELIEDLVSKKFSKRIPLCKELGDTLGEDHDLFMVLRALGGANQTQLAGDDARLARRIGGQRAKLQKQAFKFGKKLYRKKPRSFAMRIKRGFDTPPKTTKTRNHHSANGLNKLNKMQFANLHPARYLHTS